MIKDNYVFITVSESLAETFDTVVSRYLLGGEWELHGSPFAIGQYSRPAQCLVRVTPVKKPAQKKPATK
jgi:hypothetical protein